MLSRASIAMAAGADLVVEGTVDFVLLRAKNGGEIVGHDEGLAAAMMGTDRRGSEREQEEE